MDYLQNHIWCSSSHWDGKHYDCRHLVSVGSYKEDDPDKEDFNKMVYYDEVFLNKEMTYEGKTIQIEYPIKIPTFENYVFEWLDSNVKDRGDTDSPKGWCIGDDDYRYSDKSSITVFFHRKTDAMNFIKTFSKYKKPVNYCQYFTDVRKTLDLTTLKYTTK